MKYTIPEFEFLFKKSLSERLRLPKKTEFCPMVPLLAFINPLLNDEA